MPSAQTAGRPIARAVAPGRGQFVDALVELTRAEIRELNHDDDLTLLLHASIEENVARLLAVLGDGADPTAAPPFGAMEYARRLGASPASLASLLRAYRIGQARFTAHCLEVAAALDVPVSAEQQIWVVNQISAYLDHVCEQVTLVYQDEHERWLRGQEGARQRWIGRLLEGSLEPGDELRAGHELNYSLGGPHVAIEVWSSERGTAAQLDQAGQAVLAGFGVRRGALVVRRDERTLWLWCHPLPGAGVDRSALPAGVRAAIGSVQPQTAGFRQSRLQASAVRSLMLTARHAPVLTAWHEVAAVAAMSSSEHVPSMIAAALGGLAEPAPRLVALRETLRVWLESHRSHTATAAALHLHRNTVNYRVNQALELCGGTPEGPSTFALLAALEADRWLGDPT